MGVPLIEVPLIGVPHGVPLIGVPLIGMPLIGVPHGVPLIGVPLLGMPLLGSISLACIMACLS